MKFRWFLSIGRVNGDVCLDVDSGLSIEQPRFRASINMGSEAAAELMASHLRGKLAKLVEKAREEAYIAGYRDGRGKKAKQTWHHARLGWEE